MRLQAKDAAKKAREEAKLQMKEAEDRFNTVCYYMIKTKSELCGLKKRDAALDAKV